MNTDFSIKENITNIKIDIGLGQCNSNSLNWLQNSNNLLIVGIDPNPDSINRSSVHINRVLQFNTSNQFQIIPVALSNVTEPTYMNFFNTLDDPGTSSLYEPSVALLGPIKEKLNVPVYSLKHFFEKFPFDRFEYIDYIKIDTQGSDFDIIKGAGDFL